MPSSDGPWAKMTVTPEAVDRFLQAENEVLIDCARVLEAFTGCTGTGYHRWLERRDKALANLDEFFAKAKGSDIVTP